MNALETRAIAISCCPLCNMKYSNTTPRLPHILHCSHGICTQCIQSARDKGSESIRCQICFSSTTVNEDLPINFYILGLLHAAPPVQPIEEASGASSSTCGNCYKCEKIASTLCDKCLLILCSECFAITHASFVAHRLVSISTKADHQNQFNKLGQNVFCQHQQATFFCVDCNILVCVRCNSEHGAHKLKSVGEANATKGPLITKSINKFKEQLTGYQRTSADLKIFTDKMKDFAREASEAIDVKFARVIGFAQTLQIEKKKELQKETSSVFEKLEEGKQVFGENCTSLEDAIEVLENTFTEPLQYCLAGDLITRLDQKLPVHRPIGLKKTAIDNPFRFDFIGETTHAIRKLAKVTVNKNVIPQVSVSGEKHEEAKEESPTVSRSLSSSSRYSSERSNEFVELVYERDGTDGSAGIEAPIMSGSALPEQASRNSRSLHSQRGGLAKSLKLTFPSSAENKRASDKNPKSIFCFDKIKMTKNGRFDVKITKIKDFDDFYAFVTNFEDEAERRETFSRLQEFHNKYRSSEPIKRVHDDFCGVVQVDGSWLRCIVMKVFGPKCEVFTVDTAQLLTIGNEDLHRIGKCFMMPKQAAIHCCLPDDIVKDSSAEHINKLVSFKKIVIDSGFPTKIEVMSDSDQKRPVPVTVFVYPPNGEPININKKFGIKPKPM